MTSYEQPESALLVEHLLPSLLGADHSLSDESQARTLFFGELATTLETLRDRLTVISSRPRGPREDSQYPWLWRYVSHFNVGAEARAVQHAKLWAFHWRVGDDEHLELHVSSTNLTASAFKAQLQAGWHVRRRLGARATRNTGTWGALLPFLNALGASAGAIAVTRVQRLVALLGRAECPAGVTFVASVPGQKSAARQLAPFEPSEIHVLTPTIGEWNDRALSAWSTDVGVLLKRVHLKWISDAHPWGAVAGWALSTAAAQSLENSGVRLECLPTNVQFTEEHRDADPRWSHAKLYLLRSRRKRLLLVTSANWSASAWGAGQASPRNFELGVVFESEWTGLADLGEPFDPPKSVPYCVERHEEEGCLSTLEWAEASWDGTSITLRARSTDGVATISALVTFNHAAECSVLLADGEAAMPWSDAERTPLTARFTQGAETLEVDVLDLRSSDLFGKTPLPEVDAAVQQAMREAFLLQRYGGPVVDPESIPWPGGGRKPTSGAPPVADYGVQAWIDARAAFCVVDRWYAALKEAGAESRLVERVRLDGEELCDLFARRKDPGAALVVEELRWRLDQGA